jgi:hypothetical protein
VNYAVRLVQTDGQHRDLWGIDLDTFPSRGTVIEWPKQSKMCRMEVLFVALAPRSPKGQAADQIWAREL